MPFQIGTTGAGKYSTNNKDLEYGGGIKLSNGNIDGKDMPMICRYEADAIYTNKQNLNVKTKVDLGGQVPFTKEGCHQWYTTSGLNIFGEVKADINALSKDKNNKYSIFGGAGAEIAYRGPYFDTAVGFKAGYQYNSVINSDKEIRQEHSNGYVAYGPTARAEFWIPGTQYNTDIKGGLGIGVNAEYDIAKKDVYFGASISYTF